VQWRMQDFINRLAFISE